MPTQNVETTNKNYWFSKTTPCLEFTWQLPKSLLIVILSRDFKEFYNPLHITFIYCNAFIINVNFTLYVIQ